MPAPALFLPGAGAARFYFCRTSFKEVAASSRRGHPCSAWILFFAQSWLKGMRKVSFQTGMIIVYQSIVKTSLNVL